MKNLSRRQRQLTPLPFAGYLVGRVLAVFSTTRVAALWTARWSPYLRFYPVVNAWGVETDARRYAGPYPIIAHPPCGCWGKYKAVCLHSKEHGVKAMDLVHRWGGVVEQPVGSSLFDLHGRAGGVVEQVDQGLFEHLAIKPTLLYWVKHPELPLSCQPT